jgi:EAL domain-containing protein (putative c-di-GMP-specific phosphodiesterase class I)
MSEPLEMLAVAGALDALRSLPDPVYVAINVSAAHILSGAVARTLTGAPLARVVLEITEHEPVEDYEALAAAMEPLRAGGMGLAIDDAGAGYSSFRHILGLAPDYIKLDMSLTRDINRDRTRRALAAALTRFATETGSRIVAEGVETDAEFATLSQFGVHKVQGYLIGRPEPLERALALLGERSGA